MITFTANVRSASARSDDAITTSSVGIPINLVLADEFMGLAKTLVFKAGSTAVDVVLVGDATEAVVPPDVLTTVGLWLGIGIYAADSEGNVVIPTVWASAGLIQQGTVPSGVDPSEPTPSWVAQVQSIASEANENASDALSIAQGVKAQADAGDFDGFSPVVTVTDISGGHRVSVTDADGTTPFDVLNGVDGTDGQDGADGYSPTVVVTDITGGHRVTITDADGAHSFDVLNGTDGEDGYSPTVSVTSITGGHRVSVTDKNGTSTFDVMDGIDGTDGTDGSDGYSPTVTVTDITGGHQVTITDEDGNHTFNVMDGADGAVLSVAGKTGAVTLDGDDVAYDPTDTYASGTVGGAVSDLKSAIDDVTLDKAGTNINNCGYEGGYINSAGVDTTAATYETAAFRSVGYIPVIGGSTVYWWGKLSDDTALGANAVIVEYDSQKNLIGQRHPFNKYGTTADNQAFTTSPNAAYVRIALYQGVEDKSTIQIALYYSGDEQAAFIPYQSDKVLNYNKVYTADGESLDDVIDDKIAAIGFSPIYELQSITVAGESGALMSNGSVRETTDVTHYKIPVLAGEKYVVSARHGYAYRAFLVLDADSNILSYFPTTTSGTAIHRNVEVNITEDGFLVVQNVYNFPPYIGKAVSVDFNDKLYQKSIYWNGDSICYGAGGFSFANQIGLIHAMPETMDAVSGTRLSTRTGRTDSIYDRVVAMDTTAEYDFIGIEGGYNDYFSSVAIGTLTANYTDSPDTTTVIGAVEGICKHIRTNFPNSKFFFVLGHRPIAVGAYPTDVDTYWDAIISALEKWAVPYVDIRKEGTLMAYNADWLADYFGQGETMGTHPNTEGYTKFYNPLVEDRMKSL